MLNVLSIYLSDSFSGRQESDERRGTDSQGELRGQHKVQEDQHQLRGQQPAGRLEDEGSGEEAVGPERGTGGSQSQDQERSWSQCDKSQQSLVRF